MFAVFEQPDLKATFQFTVTAPADYIRVSSGLGEAAPVTIAILPVVFEDQDALERYLNGPIVDQLRRMHQVSSLRARQFDHEFSQLLDRELARIPEVQRTHRLRLRHEAHDLFGLARKFVAQRFQFDGGADGCGWSKRLETGIFEPCLTKIAARPM